MEQLYKDKEYKRIIKEEWEEVRLPIKHYLDKTGKSIKFTCKKVNKYKRGSKVWKEQKSQQN